jgi:hypothetical protein
MTKNLIFILALTGCGGESFTGFTPGDPVEADGGFDSKIAAGGQGEDDGGVLPTGTGGRGAGGSTSTGGTGGATAIGTGGTVVATGGSTGTGGVTGAGGVTVATGGASGTGGTTATGGAMGTGGTTACTLVTHDNGLGQTWQDCVPLYAYNQTQATKACNASGAVVCILSTRCGPSAYEVQGFNEDRSQLIGEWGYGDNFAGLVSSTYNLCSTGAPDIRHWK